MADVQYKYCILRNRAGEYLIPYCGMPEFAEVALTGKFEDLVDAPDIPSLDGVAKDVEVVHLAGSETITGAKVFTGVISLGSNAQANTKAVGNKTKAVANTEFVNNEITAHENEVGVVIDDIIEQIDHIINPPQP